MVASLETGIVTTPTLFGLDPEEMVENADVDDMKSLLDRKEAEEARQELAAKRPKPKDGPAVPTTNFPWQGPEPTFLVRLEAPVSRVQPRTQGTAVCLVDQRATILAFGQYTSQSAYAGLLH